MNQLSARFLAPAVTLALTLSVQAHPGHDWQDASARHLFTSADHLAVLALAGAALCCGARQVQERWPRLALRSVGVLAMAGAALVWGLRG